MTYYRGTHTDDPMSDWGHAMFAADPGRAYLGRGHNWTYDGHGGISIDDLRPAIIDTWQHDIGNCFDACYEIAGLDDAAIAWLREMSPEDVADSYDPSDIVDSAEAYDNDILTQWLWWRVLEPRGTYAVLTQDGAVVYDPTLISRMAA